MGCGTNARLSPMGNSAHRGGRPVAKWLSGASGRPLDFPHAIARRLGHRRANSAAAAMAALPVTPRVVCSRIAAHAPPRRRLPSGTGA